MFLVKQQTAMAAQEQLSGTIVVIIIAMAVQVCIMLVIFVKRQIMRFALRNRRGPHTHIGQGAPKTLRRETDRQLEYVAYVRHEPQPNEEQDATTNPAYYRLAALKELRSLESELSNYNSSYVRPPCGNIRSFLLNCTNGPLLGIESHTIHQLCDEYEHARHHYEQFGEEKLQVFKTRVNELYVAISRNKQRKPYPSPMKVSGSSHRKERRKKSSDAHNNKKSQSSDEGQKTLVVTSNVPNNSTAV